MIAAPPDLDNLCGDFSILRYLTSSLFLRNRKDFHYDLFDVTPGLGMVKRDHRALAARCLEQHQAGPAEPGLGG
jgi:hypothetical protein